MEHQNNTDLLYFIVVVPTLNFNFGFTLFKTSTFEHIHSVLSMHVKNFKLVYKGMEIFKYTTVETVLKCVLISTHRRLPNSKQNAVLLYTRQVDKQTIYSCPLKPKIIWTTKQKAMDLKQAIALREEQKKVMMNEIKRQLPDVIIANIFSYVPYDIKYDGDKIYTDVPNIQKLESKRTRWFK